MLPAASVARTWNVWGPSLRPVSWCGEVQALNAAPSRRHSNVDPGSFEVKLTLVEVVLISASGACVIVVSGGVVSLPGSGTQVWMLTSSMNHPYA